MYADVTASAAHHRYHGIDEPIAAASCVPVSGNEVACMRYSVDANTVIAHLTVLTLVLGGSQSVSPPRLNPNLPHVDIYPPAYWNLRLFARRDMSGRPAIEAKLERAGQGVRDLLRSVDGVALGGITFPHPLFGPLSLYQWFGFIAAHGARHAAQIREAAASL